ncbi:hypothetical protein [Bacteroides sp. 224]|uniref:hypothetical protein n=1 Tax=Bacteroides sp. 224 TaxID=2302936 RepID=UPI0013D71E54|nr:hypothetical protein [Bacteroides sp. 224]
MIPNKLLPFEEIRNYEVRMNIIAESEFQKSSNELTYDIAYQYIEKKKQGHLVRLNKSNVRLNDKIILNLFDDILQKVSKCLYQLDILTDDAGSIIEITNWERIKELWFVQRSEVELTYKGNIVTEFLDKMEANLVDSKSFHELINGDLFTFFFCYPFFRKYEVVSPPAKTEIANSWIIEPTVRATPKPYIKDTTRELTLKNLIGRSDIYYTVKEKLHLPDFDKYKFSISGHSKKHRGLTESLSLMLKKSCTNQPFYSAIEGESILATSGAIKTMKIKIDSRMGSLYKKKVTIMCNLKGE